MSARLQVGGLVAAFLAAIVAANVTLANWGPSAIVPNAFVLIGLDLITRDRLADFWGTRRWSRTLALIAAGGLLSWWLSRNAATIAEASAVSFAAAECCEAVAYHLLRRQRWADRAPRAATIGAIVDSVVFPTLAFGSFAFGTSLTQFAAKLAGAVVWMWLLGWLTSPPAAAPETT